MRNLKKILALVLALVMSFSVMTVSSAAFKDEDKISADYAEAIDVLNYIGVFRGDENGKFNPQKNITRAEVAAIIYRITTGDTTDAQAGFYADLNMFTDVAANDWFAGYVNYCASAEYIKGRGNGTFDPQGKITGYDALTMILRAIGYDKNGEFTGEGYTVKVAQIAKERGITDSLKNVALGSAATREVIAEILFNTINVEQVSYTLAFGYSIYANPLQQDAKAQVNKTLGYENFLLDYDGTQSYTEWGVPFTYGWYIDWTETKDYIPNYDELITSYEFAPVAEYFTAVPECDIAKDLGIANSASFNKVTENGTVANTNCGEFDGTINATATKTLVGAQGRWTRIYKVNGKLEMVMMDQFLGEVVDVVEITYDRNGHVIQKAEVYVDVYDNFGTQLKWTSDKGNYDYTIGEFVLLNHKAALNGNVDETSTLCNVLGAPETLVGAQTAFTTRNSHIVNDVEYADAFRFYLDQAGTQTGNHTWMFDTYGNLIAVIDIPVADNTAYGTITAIKWVDEYNTLSNGYALASITYIDGTSTTMKIYAMDTGAGYVALQGVEGKNSVYGVNVSSTKQYNDSEYALQALYAISTDAYGRIYLKEQINLANATTTTGVAALGKSGYYAGNTTKFLVYNPYTYEFETYVGIKNIPSYVAGDFWAVDRNSDLMTEMVFIIGGVEDYQAATSYGTFFAYDDDKLTVTHKLYSNNVYEWTVHGGLVNGVEDTFSTRDYSVVQEILAYQGILMKLSYADELVVGANRITTYYESNTPAKYQYAVYAGDAYDAYIIDGVMFADGDAYDVEGTTVISEYRNLNDTLKYAKAGEYFLYVIYTYAGNTKAALTVYISDVAGYTYQDILTENVENAIANVNTIKANLDAAVAELATRPAALDDLSTAELLVLIENLKAELAEAVKALETAVEKAQDNKADVPAEAATAIVEANTSIEDATETGAAAIAVESVEVVYAVDADVKAVVVAAVKAEVEAIESIAALIEDGAVVTVSTKFDFADAADTNEVDFVVTVTYGEVVAKYDITVVVTATVKEAE